MDDVKQISEPIIIGCTTFYNLRSIIQRRIADRWRFVVSCRYYTGQRYRLHCISSSLLSVQVVVPRSLRNPQNVAFGHKSTNGKYKVVTRDGNDTCKAGVNRCNTRSTKYMRIKIVIRVTSVR